MRASNTNWIPDMKILITGADGFIGRNLSLRLLEAGYSDLIKISRESNVHEFEEAVKKLISSTILLE